MKNLLKIFILMMSVAMLTSCENESSPFELESDGRNNILTIIGDFRAGITSKSRASSDLEVLSVDTKYYKIESDTVVETKPARSDETVFDISTVQIRIGKEIGFAILSTDERLDKIFYYTENGNISDTIHIRPLKDYIDKLPFFAANEFIAPTDNQSTRATGNEDFLIGPIVPFKWGQSAPFNNLAPVCNCSKCAGHMPIGCVATATAQTIATIGSFKSTFFGSRDIDFKTFPRYYYYMNTKQQSQISHFFYEVALCCQVKFGCGGSGSYVKSAYHYLKDLGYSCSYVEGSINQQQLIYELQQGYPHLMGGSGGSSGHMWIVDGIKSSGGITYFSCNWGWNGSSDGWISGNPYTVTYSDNTTKSFSKNLRHIYIHSKPM